MPVGSAPGCEALTAERDRLSAAAVIAARRQLSPRPMPWRLRSLRVCASTEVELSQWLQLRGHITQGDGLRAVLADRQRFGHGQRGRPWSAPIGGVWLSASLPWPAGGQDQASLSLAVVVGLALELEALNLRVRIKWPNDLLVAERKIAGVLPRLRLRAGQVVGARVGIGLNGCNRVPVGAINLVDALALAGGQPRRISSAALAARTLRALEWAVQAAATGEAVRQAAEARLLPGATPVLEAGELWQPIGLDRDGALRVCAQGRERRLLRSF